MESKYVLGKMRNNIHFIRLVIYVGPEKFLMGFLVNRTQYRVDGFHLEIYCITSSFQSISKPWS